MVSPFANQASDLNADMVDLQNEADLNSYAKKVASGKRAPSSSSRKQQSKAKKGGDNGEATMEVRSRRIIQGEMVYNGHYPAVETTLNLAISILVGLVCRWVFGLFRSLKLSKVPGGPCCSPFRGGNDEGTRLPGSFERLLLCILVKQEGDTAGDMLFSALLVVFFAVVLNLTWSVSSPSASKNEDDLGDEFFGADKEKEKRKKDESAENPKMRRINPRKAKRFLVGVGATLSSLMLFHTPSMLRMLGLDGLTEAVEEWASRILLFANLLGIASLPQTISMEEPSEAIQNLMNGILVLLALAWGYVASGMMTPMEETARNAAHLLQPSSSVRKGKRANNNPKEMLDLINARIMLLIQAMAPFLIMCTYLFNVRFAETMKTPARGSGAQMMQKSFSKQYLQNSGLFVRVVLSWCFVGASLYTLSALLQSFLDQASTVASAMATLGEGIVNNDGNGSRKKQNTGAPPKVDPFNDRYKNLVLTAGRIAAFPAFVMAILAVAHLRGGDGSIHPGVGYESQPKDAPRMLPTKGLLPPYSDQCMMWSAKQIKQREEIISSAGDTLLQAAALSQQSWDTTPFRDSAHKTFVDLLGRNRFCYPPEFRSVKAVGRHVNSMLDNDGSADDRSILTYNPLTGRELLDMAPPIPAWTPVAIFSEEGSCDNSDMDTDASQESNECKISDTDQHNLQYPSFSETISFLFSHNFLTPTVVFPILDTIAFLSSVWWSYWYSLIMIIYYFKLRGAAFMNITA